MSKYPISQEFKSFSRFAPPISKPFVLLAQKFMKVPAFLTKDPELEVENRKIPGYQGAEIDVYILTPKGCTGPMPCLMDYHGGGFVLEGANYHFSLAMEYAKRLSCKVVFPKYRLAPRHPFPTPVEDGYAAMEWVYDHAGELGIDREKMAVCGDSAGAQLSASVCLLARDRKHPVKLRFQTLIYPFLDERNSSESAKKYTDTPMWNSRLTARVSPILNPDGRLSDKRITSPVEVEDLRELPPAYIETAEFDCLHDDGTLYAHRLREAGVPVALNETRGTIHGFDIVLNCPTTRAAVESRVSYMREHF